MLIFNYILVGCPCCLNIALVDSGKGHVNSLIHYFKTCFLVFTLPSD